MSRPPLLARRCAGVVSERFAAETLVLEPTRDRYVRLNESGSLLWEWLQTPALTDELAVRLAERWSLDLTRAQGDVLAFLGYLADRGLVELTPP